MSMSGSTAEPFPAAVDLRDKALMFVGRPLQSLLPIMERMGERRGLTAGATAFLCSLAMLGAPDSAKAGKTPLMAGPGPVVTQAKPGVSGQEVAVPGHLVPPLNRECGDPDYRAPEQAQIGSMLCRFNKARSLPLIEDPELEAAAEAKLEDIVGCRHFSHRPCAEDEDPFLHTKEIKGTEGVWVMGEDLAYGEGPEGKVRWLFGAWRQSSTHWSNIINERFTHVGFARKHVRRIVMDVDTTGGLTYGKVVLRNVTLWAAEFWGEQQ